MLLNWQVMQDPRADAKAKGFSKKFYGLMLRADVVLFCHFLLDVVNVLSQLSLIIQRSKVTIGTIFQAMETVKKSLHKQRTKYGLFQPISAQRFWY